MRFDTDATFMNGIVTSLKFDTLVLTGVIMTTSTIDWAFTGVIMYYQVPRFLDHRSQPTDPNPDIVIQSHHRFGVSVPKGAIIHWWSSQDRHELVWSSIFLQYDRLDWMSTISSDLHANIMKINMLLHRHVTHSQRTDCKYTATLQNSGHHLSI